MDVENAGMFLFFFFFFGNIGDERKKTFNMHKGILKNVLKNDINKLNKNYYKFKLLSIEIINNLNFIYKICNM